ncbi:hypothetical protein VNO77_42837 [Canavalia gladiata]|uniref:Uncharacterized protein n=1 Tax=Canavalia gladiata TaxID=3824 RepID=A0AAN9JTQ4_CANGL
MSPTHSGISVSTKSEQESDRRSQEAHLSTRGKRNRVRPIMRNRGTAVRRLTIVHLRLQGIARTESPAANTVKRKVRIFGTPAETKQLASEISNGYAAETKAAAIRWMRRR